MGSRMLPLLVLLLLLPGRPAVGHPEASLPASDPAARCGVRSPAAPPPGLLAAGAPDPGPPPCFACGESASYRAFDGTDHGLTRYPGRFTEILLPSHWIDGEGLGDSERRLLLDRADFVYAHARELMGRDPGGDGRLQIAFVGSTCGYGCGNVGSKGVEVVSSEQARSEIRGDLAVGVLPRIIVHEMAHNFDLFAGELWEGPPSSFDAHAWTTFFDPYLQIYTRMGSTTASPDDVQKASIASTWGAYASDPEATWERCIASAACGPAATPNAVWGGATHRFAQLHGVHAARSFLAALPMLRAERGAPQSLQDKADLHFEALAAGAGSDLGCYADAWRWSISNELRVRLAELPAEPRCIDLDADGVTPLAGDCDDDDPEVRPGAAEVPNGHDDDCNDLVDDLVLTEPPGGDFAGALLSFPGRAEGALTAGRFGRLLDRHSRRTRTSAFEVCSKGFEGFFFVYEGSRWLGWQYVAEGQCSRRSYRLSKGRWRVGFEAHNVSKPGDYALAVGPGTPWPAPLATASEPLADVCRVIVGAPGSPAGSVGTDRTRFWVTGRGFVAEAAQPDPGRAAFFPGEGAPSVFALREQPFDGDVPSGDWTAARSVAYSPPAGAACGADPDGDGVESGADNCPAAPNPDQDDLDGDGTGDACDVCVTEIDGPLRPDAGGAWQRDTDGDGYGNACDPDLDGDGVVNFRDLARMKAVFFRSDAHADLDGDGVVNFRDLARLKARMFGAPGPSALAR